MLGKKIGSVKCLPSLRCLPSDYFSVFFFSGHPVHAPSIHKGVTYPYKKKYLAKKIHSNKQVLRKRCFSIKNVFRLPQKKKNEIFDTIIVKKSSTFQEL